MDKLTNKSTVQIACYESGTNRSSILGIFNLHVRDDADVESFTQEEIDESISSYRDSIVEAVMKKFDRKRKDIEVTTAIAEYR